MSIISLLKRSMREQGKYELLAQFEEELATLVDAPAESHPHFNSLFSGVTRHTDTSKPGKASVFIKPEEREGFIAGAKSLGYSGPHKDNSPDMLPSKSKLNHVVMTHPDGPVLKMAKTKYGGAHVDWSHNAKVV